MDSVGEQLALIIQQQQGLQGQMSMMGEHFAVSNARFDHLEDRMSQLEPNIRTNVVNQVVTQVSPMISAQVAAQLQEALTSPQFQESLANLIRPPAPPSTMSGIEAMGVPTSEATAAPTAATHVHAGSSSFSFQQPGTAVSAPGHVMVYTSQISEYFKNSVPRYDGSKPGQEKVSSHNFLKAVEACREAIEQPLSFKLLIINAASRFVQGGKANLWYTNRITSAPFPSWEVFKQEFLEAMKAVDEAVQLRLRLRELNMSGNLFAYISEFQNIVYQLNAFPNPHVHITMSDQVLKFAEGLPQHLRARINLGLPDLDAAIARVQNRENTQLTQRAFNSAYPARAGPKRGGRSQMLYQVEMQQHDSAQYDEYGSDLGEESGSYAYEYDDEAELAAVVGKPVGRRGRGNYSRAAGRGRGRGHGRGASVSGSSYPRGGSNYRGRGRGGRGRGRAQGGRSVAWEHPEADERRRAGVCVGCGQQGHWLDGCPKYAEPKEENS